MFNTRLTRLAFPILRCWSSWPPPRLAPGAALAGDQPAENPTGGFTVAQETVVHVSPRPPTTP